MYSMKIARLASQSKRENCKLKITLFVFLTSSFLLLTSELAQASSVSLRISPPVIKIQTKVPSDIASPVNVENRTEQTVELEVVLQPFKARDEQGEISYLPINAFSQKPDPTLLDKVQIIENDIPITHVTLSPFEKKNLTLSIRLPAEEKPADYYFSILYIIKPNQLGEEKSDQITNEDEKKTSINIESGIAQNVLLSIYDHNIVPQGAIEEFSTSFFNLNGPISITLRVKNSSPYFINPQGTLTVKNMFNQTVGAIDLPQSSILSHSSRLFTSGSLSSMQWTNGYLFGIYTATITIALSNPSLQPPFVKTIHFLVVPAKQIVEIVTILFLVVIVKKRIKKYQ